MLIPTVEKISLTISSPVIKLTIGVPRIKLSIGPPPAPPLNLLLTDTGLSFLYVDDEQNKLQIS